MRALSPCRQRSICRSGRLVFNDSCAAHHKSGRGTAGGRRLPRSTSMRVGVWPREVSSGVQKRTAAGSTNAGDGGSLSCRVNKTFDFVTLIAARYSPSLPATAGPVPTAQAVIAPVRCLKLDVARAQGHPVARYCQRGGRARQAKLLLLLSDHHAVKARRRASFFPLL